MKIPRKFRQRILTWGAIFLLAIAGVAGDRSLSANDRTAIFSQVWQTVDREFFDPKFNGVDWPAMKEQYGSVAAKARSREEFAVTVNEMLSRLRTSHTSFYIPEDPRYYQLLAIFAAIDRDLQQPLQTWFPNGKIEYTGIGIFTEQIGEKTFVSGVLDGSPAERAGLLVGDRLLSVNGKPYHPIESFRGKAGRELTLTIEREPGQERTLPITPKVFDAGRMFEEAMSKSVEVIERDSKKIGYIHIWSYAGEQYQRILEQELLSGRLRNADALVLDLRGGWGGAPLTALNIFTASPLSFTAIPRNGRSYVNSATWTRPVIMLVDEKSRSSKEILAHAFREKKIGPVIGDRTPGAVVGGRAFLMADGSLLYVAVVDVYVNGNTRLEGKGVTPDIGVPFDLPYARGADPRKERAIEEAFNVIAAFKSN
ncbi:S41 family peptidase [Pannus brasiliensis CCIBt3594]|uniref:S41 family peptidase n=1 Tax=Pannus brasiliensis CCIBt3594 TaxID=1427578 RepID=A0AAW9QSN7_9CHRO